MRGLVQVNVMNYGKGTSYNNKTYLLILLNEIILYFMLNMNELVCMNVAIMGKYDNFCNAISVTMKNVTIFSVVCPSKDMKMSKM